MREATLGLVLLGALLLPSCADASNEAGASIDQTELRFTVEPPDPNAGVYIEGALRYVHVTGSGVDLEQQLADTGATTVQLPGGGSYVVESYARVCGGNCNNLSSPTDRCDATFAV